MLTADSELLAVLTSLPATAEDRDLQNKRDTLFSSSSGIYTLDASEWFDATTKRLGNLNNVRKKLLDSTLVLAVLGVTDARRDLFVASGIAAAAVSSK